jgi:hypothetical protein
MVSKIERSILVDRKLEKIKQLAGACEQTGTPDAMNENLKALMQMIREI